MKHYLSRISISLVTLGLVGLTALTALAAQRVQIRLTIQLLDHERFTATATDQSLTLDGSTPLFPRCQALPFTAPECM